MLRVLIVDDNVRSADGLAASIDYAAIGFECVGVAYNGEQALEQVRIWRPSVVITDVRMPIMDGLELTRRLRQEYPGIAIIILSAYDEFDYARTAIEYGVGSYILKPLDRKKLDSLTQYLLDIRNRLERQSAVLSDIADIRNKERICLAVLEQDYLSADAQLASLIDHCHQDYNLVLLSMGKVAEALFEESTRHLHQDQKMPMNLTQVLSSLGAESSIEQIHVFMQNLLRTIGQAIAEARNMTASHIAGAIGAYIDRHFSEPDLSAAQIMDHFHISQSYLYLIFKRYQHMSLNGYITHKRMDKALNLLGNPNAPIGDIARCCGYTDAHYFTRVFKKLHGLTPADYRRLHFDGGDEKNPREG